MTTIKKSIFLLGTIAALATGSAKAEQASKSLIVYFSNTGTTEKVANILQKKTGADIARIECEKPYSSDFMAAVGEWQQEMQSGTPRALKPLSVDIAKYETIYLGFPIWGGNYATPVSTFLKGNDLKGKTIIPFCTFGSGGNTAIVNLTQALPDSKILSWYGVRAARINKAEAEVEAFLVGLGVLPGKKEALPAFSAQRELTAEESAIFHAACDSYQMPLGTPVSVGLRKLAKATEYLYVVKARGMDGKEAEQKIYVIKGDEQGAVPEFTQVER